MVLPVTAPPLTLTLNISPAMVANNQGPVIVALFGQLTEAPNPKAWYYLSNASTDPNNPDPQFVEFTQASENQSFPFNSYGTEGCYTIKLPNTPGTLIKSGRIVFGVGTLPNTSVALDADGFLAPSAPVPTILSIYDFVEFSYLPDPSNIPTLSINTSMVDQFGFPIHVQIDPKDPTLALANGVGVIVSRDAILPPLPSAGTPPPDPNLIAYTDYVAQSKSYNNTAYLQCAQNMVGGARTNRILSPGAALEHNCVPAVELATDFANVSDGLPPNRYYYAICPARETTDAQGKAVVLEGFAQAQIVQINLLDPQINPNQQKANVYVKWGSVSEEFKATVTKYNVYRGTHLDDKRIAWALISSVLPPDAGGMYYDTGTQHDDTTKSPTLNPLATIFDNDIRAFFKRYKEDTLILTATDGSSTSPTYTFHGKTITHDPHDPAPYLRFTLESATATPHVLLNTIFKVYHPLWNTNTYDLTNPAPPLWMQTSWQDALTTPASMMVLAADGVFADNAWQMQFNLPPGVEPTTDAATAYSVLLGSLENQIVSALTRGIADQLSEDMSGIPYFPEGRAWSVYDAFFHRTVISESGRAYAAPFDDQGGQSSLIATQNPTSVIIILGVPKSDKTC